jgi:hypothetical protein
MVVMSDDTGGLDPELVARVRAEMARERVQPQPAEPDDDVGTMPEPLTPVAEAKPSIRRLHALTHRQSCDVYAERGMPGELVVEYLRSEAMDPHIKTTLDKLKDDGDEVAMSDFMADYLERVLYSWNLDEPLNRDNIVALRPLIMQDIMLALVKGQTEKKA